MGSHRTSIGSTVNTTIKLNDTVGNNNVTRRILVNTTVNAELNVVYCVKSNTNNNDFSNTTRKSKTNIVSLHN